MEKGNRWKMGAGCRHAPARDALCCAQPTARHAAPSQTWNLLNFARSSTPALIDNSIQQVARHGYAVN
eukprot:13064494-Alexandrium_andersonii.AAC.1